MDSLLPGRLRRLGGARPDRPGRRDRDLPRLRRTAPTGAAIPSPNIWNWPDVYAAENAAQDADGALWAALRRGDRRLVRRRRRRRGLRRRLPPAAFRRRRRVRRRRRAAPAAGRAGAGTLRRRAGPGDRGRRGRGSRCRTRRPTSCTPAPRTSSARAASRASPRPTACCGPAGCSPSSTWTSRAGPYGDWLRADLPRYDAPAVERFFARHGFAQRRVVSTWRFDDRATLEDVLRIEFSRSTAQRAIDAVPGLTITVGYRLHTRRRPDGVLLP